VESAAPNLASMTSGSEDILSETASSSASESSFIASIICRNSRREIDQCTFEPSPAARPTWTVMNWVLSASDPLGLDGSIDWQLETLRHVGG